MMRIAHSTTIFAGAFAVSLFLAPPPIEAKTFGYFGVKTGYAHGMLPKTEFTNTNNANILYLDATSAVGLPLGLSIGAGYDFGSSFGVRMEAEYTYHFMGRFKGGALKLKGDSVLIAKPSANFQSLLGNLYFDYYLTPSMNFYLSTGIGIGYFGVSTEFAEGRIHNFTSRAKQTFNWQVGLGVGYALTESLGLDFGVRYMNFGKSFFKTSDDPIQTVYKFSAIEALVGLSYRF